MPEVKEILVSKNGLCQSPRSSPQAIRNASSAYEIVKNDEIEIVRACSVDTHIMYAFTTNQDMIADYCIIT